MYLLMSHSQTAWAYLYRRWDKPIGWCRKGRYAQSGQSNQIEFYLTILGDVDKRKIWTDEDARMAEPRV